MPNIYNTILKAKESNKKLLGILIDPDKIDLESINCIVEKINQSPATHILFGGSHVQSTILDKLILKIKENCSLPILLFPGNPSQISTKADGILYLSLISGRNPDFLIEHQVNAVPMLMVSELEVISTSYILIDGGVKTAVEVVSQTKPLDRNNIDYIIQTAQAGVFLGHQLIYLEAGSGAKYALPFELIEKVAKKVTIPLLVGGGIVNLQGISNAMDAGADMVVIGTAFENDINFFSPINNDRIFSEIL